MDATGEGTSQYADFCITRLSRQQAQEKISDNVPDFSSEFKSSVTEAKRCFTMGWHLPKTGLLCVSKSESDLAGESVYFFCSPIQPETKDKDTKSPKMVHAGDDRSLWKGEMLRCNRAGSEWLQRDFVLKPGKLLYYHKNELKSQSFTICGRTRVQQEKEIDGESGLFVVIKLNNNENADPVLLDAITERRQKMFMKALKVEILRLRQGIEIDKFWETQFEVTNNNNNKHTRYRDSSSSTTTNNSNSSSSSSNNNNKIDKSASPIKSHLIHLAQKQIKK